MLSLINILRQNKLSHVDRKEFSKLLNLVAARTTLSQVAKLLGGSVQGTDGIRLQRRQHWSCSLSSWSHRFYQRLLLFIYLSFSLVHVFSVPRRFHVHQLPILLLVFCTVKTNNLRWDVAHCRCPSKTSCEDCCLFWSPSTPVYHNLHLDRCPMLTDMIPVDTVDRTIAVGRFLWSTMASGI